MQLYNLTYPQKNIWLMEKYNGNTSLNYILGVVEIKNGFDYKKCNDAINDVIKNNDAMRIVTKEKDSNVCQYVKDYEYVNFENVDMSLFSDKEKEKYINDFGLRSLFLEKNVYYDFKILKYSDEEGLILAKLHHIISDAWSFGNIGTQIIDYLEDNDVTDNKKPSYIDYIKSEDEYKNSEKYKKDELFWQDYLKDIKESISLKDNINRVSSKAKRYSVLLDENFSKEINNYCKENKISPYILFLTALSVYLYRIKDKNDFVIGTPTLNRSNFKEKNMLGMFVSTLPFRAKITEDIKFIDLAKQFVRENMSLFRHQKYPYEKMLEYVHKNTSLKTNLYNILLSYQNARITNMSGDKYNCEWKFLGNIEDEIQIHIMDINNTGNFNINYDYLVDLFTTQEIKYLHSRLIAIIKNAISNVDISIEDIDIMSDEEKDIILNKYNNTFLSYPKDKMPIEIFEKQVKDNPNEIALVFENQSITFEELNERSNTIANYLLNEKEVKNNDIIAILMNRSIDIIISILGILKAGAAYLPIDPDYPMDRINYMIENSNVKVLLTNLNNNKNNILCPIININDIKMDKDFVSRRKSLDDLFYILYTSGSTGKPKGVKITNQNFLNLLYHFKKHEIIRTTKQAVSLTTISFDIFAFESIVLLFNGISVVIANEEEQRIPTLLEKLLKRNNIDLLQMTPSRFRILIDNIIDVPSLKKVKNIVLAGEQLPLDIKNIVVSWKSKIYNGYGPTEATIFSSFNDCSNETNISIGRPLSNLKYYILDKKKRLLPLNELGELYILGDGVSSGYINNSNLTNKYFEKINNSIIYKSGDICKIGYDLKTYCYGRIDNQIKIRGQRIEVEEIEKVIKSYYEIKNCVVLKKQYQGKDILISYITCDNKVNISLLRKEILKKLPRYMVPNVIIQIDKMPHTPNGKIDKRYLLDLNISKTNLDKKEILMPRNDIENIIYKYISNNYILNNEKISIEDNFFEIGLDSLNMIEMLVMINNKFNLQLKVSDIITNPTIVELSNLIINKLTVSSNNNYIVTSNKKYFELTQSQLRIFSTYTANPDNTIYNMPVELKLSKNIDFEKLKLAFENIISKNDAFSLQIRVVENKIVFVSKNDEKIDKIKEISEKDYYKYKKEFLRPFDLLNEKLYRVEMYKTENNIYILFDVHHIICDGLSLNIFFKEIVNEYNGVKQDIGSFKHYLLNNKVDKNSNEYKLAKNFFNKMFDEGPVSTSLKLDHKRKDKRTYNGKNISVTLKSKLLNKLNSYVTHNKLTYNSVFLTILNIVLSKYTAKDDVVIGLATLGRKSINNNNTIGMFVETLPYKTKVQYDDSVINYLRTVRNDMFEVMNNDIYPIDELISDLSIPKENNKNALFNIMYVYQNKGITDITIENEKVEYNILLNNIAKFDITFEVMPHNKKFDINVNYNCDLYNKETIKNFLQTYINTLENMLNYDSTKKLSNLKIISKKEEDYLIYKYNNTFKNISHKKVVNKIFEEIVEKNLDKTAVVYENSTLTYKELNEKSNQVADMLRKNNIVNGDVVAIMAEKSLELIVGILGILKLGASYLPIDFELPDDRIKYMLNDSNTRFILSKKNCFRNIEKIPYEFIDFESDLYNIYSNENCCNNINEDSNAYVMYTSGSTGKPKGVMIPHKGIVRLVKNPNYIHVNENDRVLLSGTIVFDASVFEMWLSLLNGLTLYIIKKEILLDPIKFEEFVKSNKVTITLLTTSLFNQLVIYKKNIFENFRYVISGGDIMNAKIANDIMLSTPKVKLINAYGPTENSVISSTYRYKLSKIDNVPIGKPISNSTCFIIDKYGNLLPKNVPGELVVGGDGVANGYINNDELTKERFKKFYFSHEYCYMTGDMVKFDNNYNINFIERMDNQVKIRGLRIELDEIRQAMLNIPGIKEVFVNVVNNSIGKINSNKIILAYYISKVNIDKQFIFDSLKSLLPKYMLPNNIIKIDNIPLTINGKVDKTKLPIEVNNIKRNIILPRNDIERKIYNIWKELLPNVDISINDNFFNIGGDSLLATQFVTKAMVNGLKYTYSDLYNYPTIMQLAENNYDLLEEIYGISKYRYNKINELIKERYYDKIDTEYNDNVNYLLTGVTGFLGSHILSSIIDNTNALVYCVVRNKNDRTVRERVKRKLNFFFGNKYDDLIDERIKVIEGDITKNNFGLKGNILNEIKTNVDVVLHAAAMVKHYGNYNKFITLNVSSTEKIANFCLANHKKMIYISTLSNSGNMLESGQIVQDDIKKKTFYDEKSMYIGQKLYNAYVYSKYMGEYKVLKKCLVGLDACIIRIGNLTGRYIDGKYQPNVEENAFANRIKSFIFLKAFPESMLDMYVEYTPIDFASDAIVRLSRLKKIPLIVHLFNHNHVKMPEVIRIFKKLNINMEVIDNEKFKVLIEKNLENNYDNIKGIIIDLNSQKEIKYLSNIIVKSNRSIELLKKLGFEWPIIEDKYIIKYLKYLESIDFLNFN